MKSIIETLSDMPISISEVDKALSMSTENENLTKHDIVAQSYAIGFRDAREKAILIMRDILMSDELAEYILKKSGISIDEKEKYRTFIFGQLNQEVLETRINIASIISGEENDQGR